MSLLSGGSKASFQRKQSKFPCRAAVSIQRVAETSDSQPMWLPSLPGEGLWGDPSCVPDIEEFSQETLVLSVLKPGQFPGKPRGLVALNLDEKARREFHISTLLVVYPFKNSLEKQTIQIHHVGWFPSFKYSHCGQRSYQQLNSQPAKFPDTYQWAVMHQSELVPAPSI